MELQSGAVESRCAGKDYRRRHGATFIAEEEALDTLSEEQSACKEACDRSAVPDDTGRSTI